MRRRYDGRRDGVYAASVVAGHALFRALGLRITVTGAEHLPSDGPVVLASNHVSFLDFTLVGLVGSHRDRAVRFLCRHDVWGHWAAGPAMTAMGHVPVDRSAPAGAYLHARRLLRAGEAVGIFPEAGVGTSYTVGGLMPGAVALAVETGAPLLPVTLWGPQRVLSVGHRDLRRGRPVGITVSPPLTYAPGTDVRAATRELGARLQTSLTALQRRPEHRPGRGEVASWYPAHLGGRAPRPDDAVLGESTPRAAVAPEWLRRH